MTINESLTHQVNREFRSIPNSDIVTTKWNLIILAKLSALLVNSLLNPPGNHIWQRDTEFCNHDMLTAHSLKKPVISDTMGGIVQPSNISL